MKIVAKEDIEAPIQTVFARVTDFKSFERSAIRRGASVQRIEEGDSQNCWDVAFPLRGKTRIFRLTVVDFDDPERMSMSAISEGMAGAIKVELVALSRSRTRLRFETEIKPQTLSARLLVQSLRLARSTMQQRLQDRLSDLAASIEGKQKSRRA
ncbi:SRPBCC family protein [Pseudooceanicola sediminis]|uniref:SRPBCC family protein n=1 Tax=Pseudooceanicola sediminis TaxID=2211117 RepID=A0A399IX06_9RHOB|nr:SRPBCC family protein [Pseudooceanicola sediminis]KAA2312924.1 SRPBCC family protein [Puniceibacterium sp. HSS470]RII37675.1 SRPBCC family protein [Pseudooceanicola sediminis]|tara:strand:+ start:21272 stop:21733 length:462 start_codon:yes stop_codon:yes gene_type:complete